ncbi:hypothetical protein [Nostoc sp.]
MREKPMPHAPCPMPHAPCPILNTLLPTPYSPIRDTHVLLRMWA